MSRVFGSCPVAQPGPGLHYEAWWDGRIAVCNGYGRWLAWAKTAVS